MIAPELHGSVLDRFALTAARRVLSEREGRCVHARAGMGAVAKALLHLPVSRRFIAQGLPPLTLRPREAPLQARDWLARWAWLPYDSLARLLSLLVLPGAAVADVGVFTGWYSYLMAARVGRHGRVDAVEANPALRSTLMPSIGTLPGVHCHFVGAGAASATLRFHLDPTLAMSSFAWSRPGGSEVDVQVARLDDLLSAAAATGRLTFVKIDVEGYEVAALRGLNAILEENRGGRPYLFLEMTEPTRAAAARRPSEVYSMLSASGYRLYMAPYFAASPRVPLKWLRDGPDPEVRGWVDALACPPERLDALAELEQRDLVAISDRY